jgi:pSer/pThr/pTyr-binding forkhead associated (FHA) protein
VPESVLTILKFCFLALLYLFLFRVVRVVVLEMRAPAPSPEAAAPPAATASQRSAPSTRGRGPTRLRIVDPAARRGETFALADELTVGRGGGCGIVLGDDTFVSQVHARLYRRGGDVFLEDLGSRNGTFVNGEVIGGATRLRRGDQVQFGETVAEALR